MKPLLEVCVDDAHGLFQAIEGGADRIELCSCLGSGGLTPSRGLMQLAARQPIPVHALIRPRIGAFRYGADDLNVMLADIEAAREAGLAGVVIGASEADGRLDAAVLTDLLAAATGMDVTLHRAFDMAPDLFTALDLALSLGFRRILTSGGARHAESAHEMLGKLAARGEGQISIMPGGGIRPENAAAFLAIAGISELHASCSQAMAVDPRLVEFGFESPSRRQTESATVRRLKDAMAASGAL